MSQHTATASSLTPETPLHSDVLVIGSGLAGVRLALALAPHGTVRVITKAQRDEGNSRYAQGGIAAAWRESDSWENHVEDTMVAGAGLCRREVVERTAREARERVDCGVASYKTRLFGKSAFLRP